VSANTFGTHLLRAWLTAHIYSGPSSHYLTNWQRHEELLFDRNQLHMVLKLRRVLSGLAVDGNSAPALELLIDRLKTLMNDDDFLV